MLLRLIDRQLERIDHQRAEHQKELAQQRADHAADQERLIKERDAAQVEVQKARDAADKAKADQLQMALEFSGFLCSKVRKATWTGPVVPD